MDENHKKTSDNQNIGFNAHANTTDHYSQYKIVMCSLVSLIIIILCVNAEFLEHFMKI